VSHRLEESSIPFCTVASPLVPFWLYLLTCPFAPPTHGRSVPGFSSVLFQPLLPLSKTLPRISPGALPLPPCTHLLPSPTWLAPTNRTLYSVLVPSLLNDLKQSVHILLLPFSPQPLSPRNAPKAPRRDRVGTAEAFIPLSKAGRVEQQRGGTTGYAGNRMRGRFSARILEVRIEHGTLLRTSIDVGDMYSVV
jgi:hypothetical protein